MKRIFMFVMLQCFFSCREEYFVQQQKVLTDSPQFILTEGITVLGRQLKNPYSVENMRKALQNLSPRTRSGIKIEDIQTTHYYVRFHPLIM